MNPAEFANIFRCERDLWWYRGMRRILFQILEPYLAGRKIARVLEAGCGTGYFSYLLQTERAWPVVPMDISPEGLQYARTLGVERPVQGDIRALPFADGAFDMVISLDVLVHMKPGEEPLPAREFARVLAPGGLLVIRTSALNALRSRHSEFVFERQRFTRRQLTELFANSGVTVRRVTYANCLLLPVALAKFRILEPLLRRPPASGVERVPPWLDRLLYGLLVLEAAWLKAGRGLPVGQSLMLIADKVRT